jgi:hypothetical protein
MSDKKQCGEREVDARPRATRARYSAYLQALPRVPYDTRDRRRAARHHSTAHVRHETNLYSVREEPMRQVEEFANLPLAYQAVVCPSGLHACAGSRSQDEQHRRSAGLDAPGSSSDLTSGTACCDGIVGARSSSFVRDCRIPAGEHRAAQARPRFRGHRGCSESRTAYAMLLSSSSPLCQRS